MELILFVLQLVLLICRFSYGYTCNVCRDPTSLPICEQSLKYPVCIYNEDKQRNEFLKGVVAFQEKLAIKTLNDDCKNAYLAYLCASVYPSCDKCILIFRFFISHLILDNQTALPVCRDVCISYYNHCGLDANDSADICINIYSKSANDDSSSNSICSKSHFPVAVPSLISLPLTSLISLSTNGLNHSDPANHMQIDPSLVRKKTLLSTIAMPIAVSTASLVMLISLIVVSKSSF